MKSTKTAITKQHSVWPWLMAACLASPGAWSMTSAELESKVLQLEKKNKELEKKLKKLDKKTKKRDKKIKSALDSYMKRFKIDGFATAGIASSDQKSTNSGGTGGEYVIKDDPVNRADAILGLQMRFNINEEFNYVAQIVGKGGDGEEWKNETAWSYLSYKPASNLMLRAGRMRLPYYLASTYLDVGYAYPWVRPPTEMYAVILDNYDGFDATYTFNLGPIKVKNKVYYGNTLVRGDSFEFSLDDIWGYELFTEWDNFSGRINYTKAGWNLTVSSDVDIDGALTALGVPTGFEAHQDVYEYVVGGLQFDNGSTLAMLEVARTRIAGLVPDTVSGHFTVAQRIGNFQPYAYYSKTYSTDDAPKHAGIIAIDSTLDAFGDFLSPEEKAGLITVNNTLKGNIQEQTTIALGLRYDVNANVAIKGQVDKIYGFGPSTGHFDNDPKLPATKVEGRANIYTITIDTVF